MKTEISKNEEVEFEHGDLVRIYGTLMKSEAPTMEDKLRFVSNGLLICWVDKFGCELNKPTNKIVHATTRVSNILMDGDRAYVKTKLKYCVDNMAEFIAEVGESDVMYLTKEGYRHGDPFKNKFIEHSPKEDYLDKKLPRFSLQELVVENRHIEVKKLIMLEHVIRNEIHAQGCEEEICEKITIHQSGRGDKIYTISLVNNNDPYFIVANLDLRKIDQNPYWLIKLLSDNNFDINQENYL